MGVEDPAARLAEVKRRMDAIKDSHEGAFSFGILSRIGRTPVQVEERLRVEPADRGGVTRAPTSPDTHDIPRLGGPGASPCKPVPL